MAKEEKKGKEPVKGFRKFLKGFLKTIGIVLLILVLAAGVLLVIPAFERSAADPDLYIMDWMRGLPDEKKLSEIRIPGAHDAATENVELAFVTRCQEHSIKKLLTDGFRYLDIRLAIEKKANGEGTDQKLRFVHGPMKCKTGFWPWAANLYLDDVLKDCYEFLENHPDETILFVVKQESGSESVEEFQSVLNHYVSENKDRWLLQSGEIPTLGEARGKLVLFRRYEDKAGLGADPGIPLFWEDQGNKDHTELNYAYEQSGVFTLAVQDRYKYGNEDKWAAFTAKPSQETDVCISFLSTAGSFVIGHPYGSAKALNKRFAELDPKDLPEGWIILDFGNVLLAKQIIDMN
ncbi:MAG: phosphatidylinositol-specific phospholipase C domain-containing protein [Lachnospiraceae bacterium]|nr:phosphatidylinositol-specific phospholipase C domain-containing protein [Lachnospiraceae bacterium]